MLIMLCLALAGCMTGGGADDPETNWVSLSDAEAPSLPESLQTGKNGVPTLKVYDVSEKKLVEMDLEEYVEGVVAGEMKNDWPIEALKAQSILARTFVLKFCDSKKSRYDGADISTDVSEAQAYAPENINDRIRQAVEETRGVVMVSDGEYPQAWFFAHAGGKTELPSVALDYAKDDPEYLRVTDSPDSEKAPDDVKQWTAVFSKEEVRRACADSGLKIDAVNAVEVGERGASGRAKTLKINGSEVSTPSFRINIGANRLKSTLIREISIDGDEVRFSGSGFGHGVGMSQWGAYDLAEQGKNAEQIVEYYFNGIGLSKMW